ncbi:PqiC family protein [Vibrio salinus]|uniref:PqiC family protein n=1 Tax=Vibrio salinus TaxID=2899784 RepID=UPI001E38212B|nr:ABC-type transport auxiliary lipoprotein family protein [Vibrio salinus]MCE0494828.1 ABC-type transport auxiliary lipoprotein family protein [Vibrio salinus]
MMPTLKNRLVILAFGLLLTACSSPDEAQIKQYLLPYPVNVSSNSTSEKHGDVYRLKSISVPNYLQKQNIILVNQDGQVYQATHHLWAESIETQLEQNTLTYLATRLPNVQWIAPSQYQITAPYLTISLEKFDASQKGHVSIAGYWTLWSQDNKLLNQKRFHYSANMGKDGYVAMTETLSKLWYQSVIEGFISSTFHKKVE